LKFLSRIQLPPLTRDALVASTPLAGTLHGDPADRMLLAQAQRVGCALLTCVKALIAYAERHPGVPVCGVR
jgi:PIN domain nuclease of toxin-antitoxin system